MDTLVSFYFRSSLAPSTQRSYESAKRRYLQFCLNASKSPLPLTEDNLCSFAAYLASVGLAYQTIKSYLSATKHLHIESGFGDPHIDSMLRLEHVLRGIKRELSKKSSTSKPRLPMTPSILLKLRSIWEEDPSEFDNIMLWAACCMCYFGFLRSGEVCTPSDTQYDPSTHLAFTDISVDSNEHTSCIAVKIKASKTDPFRQGVTVYLGATGTNLCPVKAILAYIAVRGSAPGPFFHFNNGRFLTRDRLVKELRAALSKAHLDPDLYAGHSFRIGAATVAHAQGIDDSMIMTLGRWKSNAYQRYIKIPQQQLASLSATTATPIPPSYLKQFHPIED